MKTRGGVGNGLDNGAIRAEDPFQQVLAISRKRKAEDVVVFHDLTNLTEQSLGIFDGIAFTQGVAGEDQLFLRRNQDGL